MAPSILNLFLSGDISQELAPLTSRVGPALQCRRDQPTPLSRQWIVCSCPGVCVCVCVCVIRLDFSPRFNTVAGRSAQSSSRAAQVTHLPSGSALVALWIRRRSPKPKIASSSLAEGRRRRVFAHHHNCAKRTEEASQPAVQSTRT